MLPGNTVYYIYGVVLLAALIACILLFNFGMIWVRATTSGAKVKFSELIALRLRRVPVGLIVDNRITSVKSGIDLTIDQLSTHYHGGRQCGDGGAGADRRAQGGHSPGIRPRLRD